jgi:hypothetical protein
MLSTHVGVEPVDDSTSDVAVVALVPVPVALALAPDDALPLSSAAVVAPASAPPEAPPTCGPHPASASATAIAEHSRIGEVRSSAVTAPPRRALKPDCRIAELPDCRMPDAGCRMPDAHRPRA